MLLWRALRLRPGGFKFRRQHPLSNYRMDFACLSARLCIEVDGQYHDRGDRPAKDAARNAAIARLGFRTLRVRACDILDDLDIVVRGIVVACGTPLHPPAAPDGPPPRSGEV